MIYPVSKLCVGSYYDWTLAINEVERLANWLDLWSKAGAAPNYKVDNIENYCRDLTGSAIGLINIFLTK